MTQQCSDVNCVKSVVFLQILSKFGEYPYLLRQREKNSHPEDAPYKDTFYKVVKFCGSLASTFLSVYTKRHFEHFLDICIYIIFQSQIHN